MTEDQRLKRNAYMREWSARKRSDPEYLAKKRARLREYTTRQDVRKLLNSAQEKWRAKNPETVSAGRRRNYLRYSEKRREFARNYARTHVAEGKAYRKAHYAKNAEAQRAKSIANRRRRVEALSAIKMSRGCIDCGYKAHPEALEFDHVYGKKECVVSRAWGLKRAIAETSKCEVRCANCHRIATYTRRNNKANTHYRITPIP